MKEKERGGNNRQVEKKIINWKVKSFTAALIKRSPSVNVSTYKEGYTFCAHQIMKQH